MIALLALPFMLGPIVKYQSRKRVIDQDLLRYKNEVPFNEPGVLYLCYCLLLKKEFRSVFAYRLKSNRFLVRLIMLFCPPIETMEIASERIGGGMMLFHKSGCTISAKLIGTHFTCAQGVTIGFGKYSEENKTDKPIIEDNVWICANAVVFGGIHIGRNVTIGAGSIVFHDIPDCCVVAGNPARILHKS